MKVWRRIIISLLLFQTSVFAYTDVYTRSDFKQRKKLKFSLSSIYDFANVDTVASEETVDANESFNVIGLKPIAEYFLLPKLSIVGSYILSTNITSSTQVHGMDLGARYYFFNPSSSFHGEIQGLTINTAPGFSPFVSGHYSTRSFKFNDSNITFIGANGGIGSDWWYTEEIYFSGEALFGYYLNNDIRTLISFGVSISAGFTW